VIDYHSFCQIKDLKNNDKLTARQISEKLDLSVKTVKKWIEKDRYEKRKPRDIDTIIDPFKDRIQRLLCLHGYTAVQIFDTIKEQGYKGSYDTVKKWVRMLRPPKKKAFLTLSFEPGQAAQVDFGYCGKITVGNTVRRLSVFVMTLCYSRMMYIEFFLAERMEHFLTGHRNAFNYFMAIPKMVMVDNCKTAILSHQRYNNVVVNPRYQDLANHYGFTIKACGVRKPWQKGRVEKNIAYVKSNFLNGMELFSLEAVNTEAKLWLNKVANARLHGSTKRVPEEVFSMEKPSMLPLNGTHYDCAVIQELRSNKLFRIHYDANRYSVPHNYASTHIILYAYVDYLLIYHQEKLIARHLRSYQRNIDIENPDHPKQLLLQRKNARDQKLLASFLALSNIAETYHQNLLQKRLNPLHHIRKIMALVDIYGQKKIVRALEDASHFNAFSSDYIANLLEQRATINGQLSALHLMRKKDYLEWDIPSTNMNIYNMDALHN